MKEEFKKQQTEKNGLAGWFKSVGMVCVAGAFILLSTGSSLAGPPIPIPPGLPHPPPPPHMVHPQPPLPGPPAYGYHRPGPPPHPGWVWVPGYHRGNRWVPGHYAKPKKVKRHYAPGPPPHPGPWR